MRELRIADVSSLSLESERSSVSKQQSSAFIIRHNCFTPSNLQVVIIIIMIIIIRSLFFSFKVLSNSQVFYRSV